MRLALLLVLLPSVARAQYDGTYAVDCAAGAGSETRIGIEGDSIRFHESICRLANPVTVRGMTGATLFDATCTGEGETWAKRILLMPGSEGGLVRVEDGFAMTYARCD